MTPRTVTIAMCSMALLATACSKDKRSDKATDTATSAKPGDGEADACPALTIVVDGKPLPDKLFGQAVTMENAKYKTQMVQLYNHEKFTCEEALKGRHTPVENEVYVKAFHGMYPGVGIGAYTHVEGKLTLDKPPAKVGEPLEICVRKPIEFTPNAGDFQGKKVSIVGKFSGPYCGVWKS